MSKLNMSLYHINQQVLVSVILGSFGPSFETSASIVRGMQSMSSQRRPDTGLAKTVYNNVNKCLELQNLKPVSFDSLRTVIYSMVHLNKTANKHTAHQRYALFQKALAERFKPATITPKSVSIETKVEEKPVQVTVVDKPQQQLSGIIKIEKTTIDKRTLVQDLIGMGFNLVEAVELVKQQ